MNARLARHVFNVQLVEDAIEVGRVAGLLGGFLAVGKPFGVLGLEVVVRIAKESFGRGDELRIVVAQAENAAFVRGAAMASTSESSA